MFGREKLKDQIDKLTRQLSLKDKEITYLNSLLKENSVDPEKGRFKVVPFNPVTVDGVERKVKKVYMGTGGGKSAECDKILDKMTGRFYIVARHKKDDEQKIENTEED
ncbi:MAG: hypothetical protein K0R00_71 [Herbinix sp.]|jgi:ribose 5-phosphate isomerase|nr:hypothetical protein [Herbinix sp.]